MKPLFDLLSYKSGRWLECVFAAPGSGYVAGEQYYVMDGYDDDQTHIWWVAMSDEDFTVKHYAYHSISGLTYALKGSDPITNGFHAVFKAC